MGLILLDTNVLSEVMRKTPEPRVVEWLDCQIGSNLWTTTINVFEVRYGLGIIPHGKKQIALKSAFDALVSVDLNNRVLSFDVDCADRCSDISLALRSTGRWVDLRDVMIGTIVANNRATLATRNTRHFADMDIDLVNPWTRNR